MNTYTEKQCLVVYPCLEFERCSLLIDNIGKPTYFIPGSNQNDIKKVTNERFFDSEAEVTEYIRHTSDIYNERAMFVKKEIKELVNTEYFSFKELMPDTYNNTGWLSFYQHPHFTSIHKRINDLAHGWLQIKGQKVRMTDINRIEIKGVGEQKTALIQIQGTIYTAEKEDTEFLTLIFS